MRIRSRFAAAAVLCASALAFAAPASAGGEHGRGRHGRHHGHHERHSDRHEHRHHHGGHGGYSYAPRYERYGYGYGRGYPVYRHADYYCGPCSHYFSSYDLLAHHVHHDHHVAVISLPAVIFQASIGGGMGWVFGGY